MGDPSAVSAQRRAQIKALEDETKLNNTEIAAIESREALRRAKARVHHLRVDLLWLSFIMALALVMYLIGVARMGRYY